MNDEMLRRSFFDEIDSTPTASFRVTLRELLLDTWDEPQTGRDALSAVGGTGERPRRRVFLLAAALALMTIAGIVAVSGSGGHDSVRTGTVPATAAPPPGSTLPTLAPTVAPSITTLPAPTTAPPSSGPPATEVVQTSVGASIEQPTIAESNLTWSARAVQGDVADLPASNGYSTIFGTGPLVVRGPSWVYLSDDGVAWRRVQPVPPDMGFTLWSADAADGRVVLLGGLFDPTPADPPSSIPHDAVVLTSDDGGREWTTLPFESNTMFPPEPVRTILVIDDVVLVMSTADGYPSRLFVSTAGAPFQPVETPQLVHHIARASGEFLAIDDHSTMWRSDNGVDWTEVGPTPPGPEAFIYTFGKVGDLYAIVEHPCITGDQPNWIWLSENGTEWVASDLGGLIGPDANDGIIYGSGEVNHSEASITDAGITLVAITGSTAEASQIESDADPSLAADDEPADTESGRGVCRLNFDLHSYEVLDTYGNVRTTLTRDPRGALLPPESAQLAIVHSDDGITWSSAPINELTGGQPSYPVWITTIAGTTSIGLAPRSTEGNPPPAAVTVLNSNS